jgi:hypothetical protein
MNMYRNLVWAAAAILALAPLEARATTQSFSFETNDATIIVSGDVTISDTLNSIGGYDVTGISGTVNGSAITGLVANPNQPNSSVDSSGSWIYDNVVYSSGPWVDNSGLLFESDGYRYNFFSSGVGYILSSFNPAANYNPGKVVNGVTVATVPETATWLMMGLGFAALGAARRRASHGDSRAAFA